MIIALVIWFIRRRGSCIYLLEATVVTSNAQDYYVTFREPHPETKPIEYVWLCLLLAAKLLYNMGKERKQAEAKSLLHDLIRILGNTKLSEIDNVVQITGQPLRVVDVSQPPPGKTIVSKLAYVNPLKRFIWTSIPITWFEYQFPYTFLTVVNAVLPKLDKMHRDRLQGSLARMAELYAERNDSHSLSASLEVPHLAFADAKEISSPTGNEGEAITLDEAGEIFYESIHLEVGNLMRNEYKSFVQTCAYTASKVLCAIDRLEDKSEKVTLKQAKDVYTAILCYFAISLNGNSIPGNYGERIELVGTLVGNNALNAFRVYIMAEAGKDNADVKAATAAAARIIADTLNRPLLQVMLQPLLMTHLLTVVDC